MGAWGAAISSNDTYADIYGEFFDLYNDGLDVDEISKKLVLDNKEIIDDTDDSNNFWFALAKAQWECKQLDKSVFDRIKKLLKQVPTSKYADNLRQTKKTLKSVK